MTKKTRNPRDRANGRKSRQSTGPKSAAGKARSSRNALRHGLAVAVLADARRTQQVEELVRVVLGSNPEKEYLGLAFGIAEAQVELLRVREVRTKIMAGARQSLADERVNDVISELVACERYERRAFSRRQTAMRELEVLQLRATAGAPRRAYGLA
jgi:hypothetical protein